MYAYITYIYVITNSDHIHIRSTQTVPDNCDMYVEIVTFKHDALFVQRNRKPGPKRRNQMYICIHGYV